MTNHTDDRPQEGATLPALDLTDAVQAAWLGALALRATIEAGQRPTDLDPMLADLEAISECLRVTVAAIAGEAPGVARDDLIVTRSRLEDVARNLRKARENRARLLATRERAT